MSDKFTTILLSCGFSAVLRLRPMVVVCPCSVRQLELDSHSVIGQTVAKAAEGYLRDPRNVASESKDIACVLVAGLTHEDENDKKICQEILQELEICLVAYFSSHWQHATSVVEKVVTAGATITRFHRAVSAALRKHRYNRLMQSLRTKRRFYTMIEELRRIAKKYSGDKPEEGAVTVPAESTKRSPVILFIGGGMGAGKSTVVKHILSSSFWSGVIHDAVVVEADAFKETDVIYRHLASMSSDDIAGNAELVHQYSTEAANSLLVSALNEGRDVVFDGTMSWEPFVLQTIDMVRDIHNRRYRMGPGEIKNDDGTTTERYWEPVDDDDEYFLETKANNGCVDKRHYRIEFVGVTCDAHLAVVRGLRRAIVTRRGVPVKGQLRSHKLFAKSLKKYIEMVDAAKIYSTSAWNGPAEVKKLIALKDGPGTKLLIDVDAFPGVRCLADLNTDAGSVLELYKCCTDSRFVNQYWQSVILDPERKNRQKRLRSAILNHATTSVLLERSSSDTSSDTSFDGEFATKERSSSDDDLVTD
ncbi:hypothetical protein KC19_2G020400 [Ceratodon purpureus]|uniref:Zeta toxin domain-containing protein n=1 Tax=Ceratodon purpureus TaxID=3225 RepID=A0A8T0IQU4_CERPU|nr:hypothetical protein KC19_2G020400 [Ceratodon purpureus]